MAAFITNLGNQLPLIIPVSQGTIKNDLREAGVSLRAYGAELLPVDKQAGVIISSFTKRLDHDYDLHSSDSLSLTFPDGFDRLLVDFM